MNIAILIPELGGGGAERVAQILGDYYVDRGNRVYYFVGDTDVGQDYPVKGKIIQTGIKSSMNGELRDFQILAKLFFSSCKMRKLKWKYKIDIALSFMEEFNYLNILSRGTEKVIVRVCTILSKRQEELKGLLYRRDVISFFYSRADKVIVMSRYALKDMHGYYGVPIRKLRIIPNAVTDRKQEENGNEWQYGEMAVLCVGRLDPVKQQERIIRAFCCVIQKEKHAKLILLGKGPQLHYLKKLCEKYGISDKVVYTGFVDNVSYYLQHAKVFVMASRVEGFPNSMIEAMAQGVPVVTVDSPGACREIIGGTGKELEDDKFEMCKYGILTPPMPDVRLKPDSPWTGQENVLGEAVLKVLADKDTYERYRRQSLKRAKMFHIDKVIREWDSVMGM